MSQHVLIRDPPEGIHGMEQEQKLLQADLGRYEVRGRDAAGAGEAFRPAIQPGPVILEYRNGEAAVRSLFRSGNRVALAFFAVETDFREPLGTGEADFPGQIRLGNDPGRPQEILVCHKLAVVGFSIRTHPSGGRSFIESSTAV
jgi:hypothetical protein